MTSAEQTGEVPFAETQGVREKTFKIGRDLWNLSGLVEGMTDRVLRALNSVQDKAFTLAEKGPRDYDVEEDRHRAMLSAIRELARAARGDRSGHGGVSGGGKQQTILTVLVAINTALLCGIGGWLLVTVQRHDTELAVHECQLNPQGCRQVKNGP